MPDGKKKSKFFRVATEGATTDGRNIEKKWLQEIAQTYNQAKYGARIFIEHIRGFNPYAQSPFPAMGDVVAVKVEEVEDGKLALFAQIDPTPEMITLVGKRQKIYSSIEVAENFAGSGLAYLMGMGITDSPASLGTDVLAFAAQHPDANPFTSRKQAPGNVISAAEEVEIEFEDVEEDKPSLFSRIKDMFAKQRASDDERFADVHAAVVEIATVAGDASKEAEQGAADLAKLREEFSVLRAQADESKQAIADLTNTIDHTGDQTPRRPAAAGGGADAAVTDC